MTTIEERRATLEARIPWGEFNCGKSLPDTGWDHLLTVFFDKVEYLGAMDKIEVIQIKEKFGTLRLYVDPLTDDMTLVDIIYDLVRSAEARSEHTCERCGDFGRQRTGYWIKTLCSDCNEIRELAAGADL